MVDEIFWILLNSASAKKEVITPLGLFITVCSGSICLKALDLKTYYLFLCSLIYMSCLADFLVLSFFPWHIFGSRSCL